MRELNTEKYQKISNYCTYNDIYLCLDMIGGEDDSNYPKIITKYESHEITLTNPQDIVVKRAVCTDNGFEEELQYNYGTYKGDKWGINLISYSHQFPNVSMYLMYIVRNDIEITQYRVPREFLYSLILEDCKSVIKNYIEIVNHEKEEEIVIKERVSNANSPININLNQLLNFL